MPILFSKQVQLTYGFKILIIVSQKKKQNLVLNNLLVLLELMHVIILNLYSDNTIVTFWLDGQIFYLSCK